MKLGRRARKRAYEARSEMDPLLKEEVDRLFSPPLLWMFRSQEEIDQRFTRIITEGVQRQLSEKTTTPTTITAAVSRLNMDGASWRNFKFGDRAWQTDAWRLYDITGQLRFVANWVGNSVSRCDMYVAELNDDGSPGAKVTDPEIASLAAGPLGTGDNRAEALRLMGIDLFVAGETYVIVEAGGADDGDDLWWVVTARQIRRSGEKITVVRSPLHGGGTMEYRDGIDLILRCWTPHPNDTSEPDSPARSAIPDLREMEALRKREFAEIDSRLSGAGILALPDSLQLPRGDSDPTGSDGFFAYLMRAMGRSLRDRSSAEAMVPIMITGPAEDIDKIKHITFWSELSDQISTMREGALRSLAQSLDIPPEVLLGLGGTNHWSAWAISDEAVQTQIKPVLTRIGAALTTGYLAPALEALGHDPSHYVYVFDTAKLTTRPNRTADALQYHDRGLISDETARDAGAWGDQDIPTSQERIYRLCVELLRASPQIALSDQGIRQVLGLPIGQITTVATEETTPPTETVPTTEVEENSPPEEPTNTGDSGQPPPPVIAVAARLAARRALSLAGKRLVPHSRRPENVPCHQLHVGYGPVDNQRIATVIDGWQTEFSDIVGDLGMDPTRFTAVVNDHCRDLLSRGIAYDDGLMTDLMEAPSTVRTLMGMAGNHG